MKIIPIPQILKVISDCWLRAEDCLRNDLATKYGGADEELITPTFRAKFAEQLQIASRNGSIPRAFLADLLLAFPTLGRTELSRIASGLIADVTLHERETERYTGGDLGLLIIRPNVSLGVELISISDYRRGLLCQAKLKRATGKWGSFTKKQKEVLPERLSYLGLLLYCYKDKARRDLEPFVWQLCRSAKFSEIEEWLRNDTFPSLMDSSKIIFGIGNGQMGTDNNDTINNVISPKGNPSLVIRIYWPEGKHPGSHISLSSKVETRLNFARH